MRCACHGPTSRAAWILLALLFLLPLAAADELRDPDEQRSLDSGGTGAQLISLQLAGNPLPAYPHFEFVDNFNVDTAIHIAVDLQQFPELADKTCDVYIVQDKNAAQWQQDPTLVDASTDGATTVTIATGTIEASTERIAEPLVLSADAGASFGVGYDIVLDCDRNGRLSGGDAIDGLGDAVGVHLIHDITQAGPYAVTQVSYDVGTVFGLPGGFTRQVTYYPVDIAGLEQLPLVVVSHGNGHDFRWYNHIGEHLASYGYVVMSHENETDPGIETASTTTLGHTEAILAQQSTIAGGILNGHLDSTRIIWIGHSRGGEGVVRAYDRIFDGPYVPQHFELDDIVLLSSMAPTDFTGFAGANVHQGSFHLWTASGDDDVDGGLETNSLRTFHLFERARGFRHSTVIQGAGHGDFHNANGSVFAGPCQITPKSQVHAILKGHLLVLVEFYARRNPAAWEFLWRPWESLRPIGAPTDPCAVVHHELRQPSDTKSLVIDDYDSRFNIATSSSGGAVVFNVSNAVEGLLRDRDGTFVWSPDDPMNGMTRERGTENSLGVAFDWVSPAFYELELPGGSLDVTEFEYLSFRACQHTRHPQTTAELGDATFAVTLRDGQGVSTSIDIGAYGSGIVEPYQREGGWFNEFETVRIPVSDFNRNGVGPDLTAVEALRFDFANGSTSAQGRISLDSIEFVRDQAPPLPGGLAIQLVSSTQASPDQPLLVQADISAENESLLPSSPLLHYRYGGSTFQRVALTPLGGGLHEATLPAVSCADQPELFITATGSESGQVVLPRQGPSAPIEISVVTDQLVFEDRFETDQGWTTENLGASSGQWERGQPVNDSGWAHDPESDSDGSGQCWLTENTNGNTDIDGGAVRLISPVLDLSGTDITVRYDYYLKLTQDTGEDAMVVELSADGNNPWVEIARHDTDGGLAWRSASIDASTIEAAGGVLTATARIRFTANDGDPASIVEAGLDHFRVTQRDCISSAATAKTTPDAASQAVAAKRSDTVIKRATQPEPSRSHSPPAWQPQPAGRLIYAQPFELNQPYTHRWQADGPQVRSGMLVVLEGQPRLTRSRQSAEPILYVGQSVAEHLHAGTRSGRIVIIVPTIETLDNVPAWFGSPELPERIDEDRIAAERASALHAGIAPWSTAAIAEALAGHAPLQLTDRAELLQHAGRLIEHYVPERRERGRRLQNLPEVVSSDSPRGSTHPHSRRSPAVRRQN